jgi:hypothetical protein
VLLLTLVTAIGTGPCTQAVTVGMAAFLRVVDRDRMNVIGHGLIYSELQLSSLRRAKTRHPVGDCRLPEQAESAERPWWDFGLVVESAAVARRFECKQPALEHSRLPALPG